MWSVYRHGYQLNRFYQTYYKCLQLQNHHVWSLNIQNHKYRFWHTIHYLYIICTYISPLFSIDILLSCLLCLYLLFYGVIMELLNMFTFVQLLKCTALVLLLKGEVLWIGSKQELDSKSFPLDYICFPLLHSLIKDYLKSSLKLLESIKF